MSHESTQTVKYLTPHEVEQFVQSAMFQHGIKLDSSIREFRPVCIDGRENNDEPTNKPPVLAKPGGNAGGLMIAMAACNNLGIVKDNEKVFDTMINAIGGPENFTFHTDDSNQDRPGMGCGHLKQALLDPSAYDLHPDQMEFLFSKLPWIIEQGGEQRLHLGEHKEKAILFLESDSYGVHTFLPNPNGGEGTQAFVYHQFLDSYLQDDNGRALYRNFSEGNPRYREQDFIQAVKVVAKKQLLATAGKIAKGIPQFEVRINDVGKISVTAL